MRRLALALCLLVAAYAAAALAAVPTSDEVQVNVDVTDGQQDDAQVSMEADGDFTVAWQSDAPASGGDDVLIRRFGSAAFDETVAHVDTTGDQDNPSIASDGSDSGVVAFHHGNAGVELVRARLFDTGGPVGAADIPVGTATDDTAPAVAMAADGDFVVAWDVGTQQIAARLFDSTGTPAGPEFVVADDTAGQVLPAVAMDDAGNFVVAWHGGVDGDDGDGVYARRYDAGGNPAPAGAFRVNTETDGDQDNPAVALDADGDFVVAWHGPDDDSDGIFVQRYDSAGNALGSETPVNNTTTDQQSEPSVTLDDDGDFAVAWAGRGEGDDEGVFTRDFTAAGVPLAEERLVNETETDQQQVAWVSSDADGDFVVSWETDFEIDDTEDVFVRRFARGSPAGRGALTQKQGTAGCISEADGPCTDGTALGGALSVTVSPDGDSAYVAADTSDAVAVFDRAADGTLTQKPALGACVSDTGAGPCADGTALDRPFSVTVSPDGTSVYAASLDSDAVAVFDRAPDGTLTQKQGTAGCISESGGTCADGTALDRPSSVTVSPDGTSVYATSVDSDAVAVFDRAPDGTLTQKQGTAGCISNTGAGPCVDGTGLDFAWSVTVSPDGDNAYVASDFSDAVAVFDRAADGTLTQKPATAGCISNTGAGPCVDGTGLDRPLSVTVSPDGNNAYTASEDSDALAVFDRAPDGTLTQKAGTAGCVSDTGAGPCTDGTALDGGAAVAVSPDGGNVYYASEDSEAVAVFDRAGDGTLTQKPGLGGCISDDGAGPCVDGTALGLAFSLAVSPGDESVYLASRSNGGAVAVFDRSTEGPVTPTVSIADAAPVAEGDAGTAQAQLEVSLSAPSSGTVTVDYATADGSATQPGDYVPASDAVSFQAGEITQTVAVEVNGDTVDEPDEQFAVTISNPQGATLGDASGAVAIRDDDPAPQPPVDNTPPETSISSGPVGITAVRTPTFSFSASEPGSTFECSIDFGPFAACTSPFTAPPLPGGMHTLRVRARDSAGNVGEPATFLFQIAETLDELNAADPPTLGSDVNVQQLSGVVLVGIPGAAARAAGVRASQKGVVFVPLTEVRQIPVGSFLDTSRGAVRLSSARDPAGTVQTGDFSRGLFQVLQSSRRSARGLTDIVLKGGSFSRARCGVRGRSSGAGAAQVSRRVVRRVRSNAQGRFRTRGRHSAATVRGTVWETTDRCDGTLTKVTRGSVVVRDFRRRKNIVVRAGRRTKGAGGGRGSYLARTR